MPIGLAASLFFTPITSAVPSLLNNVNTSLGSGVAELIGPTAQAAQYNPASGQALADATNAACKATGCNAPVMQQALSGVCSIESVGCNSYVAHPGYQYQGLFQVGNNETVAAINALRQLAQSPNLSSAEQTAAASAANAAQTALNSGQNPNADPVVGAWLGVGYHLANGTLPKISAVTSDAVMAAALGMLAQIAPEIYRGNFSLNTQLSFISVLHLQMNGYVVWYGATVAQAAQAVLNKFGPTIAKGVTWSKQFTPNASPAPVPAVGSAPAPQLQKCNVTILGDSIGVGASGHSAANSSCSGGTFPTQAVVGVSIRAVIRQLDALSSGSDVAVVAGTNDYGDTSAEIQSDVQAVVAEAKAKNIQIVAWAGASKNTGNPTMDAGLLNADNAIKAALPASIPFVDLRSSSLDQYRLAYHFTPGGYQMIGNMIMTAANARLGGQTLVFASPPPGGWKGAPGTPTIQPGNPGRVDGVTVIASAAAAAPGTATALDEQTGMAYSCSTSGSVDCSLALRQEVTLERAIEAGTVPATAKYYSYTATPSVAPSKPAVAATAPIAAPSTAPAHPAATVTKQSNSPILPTFPWGLLLLGIRSSRQGLEAVVSEGAAAGTVPSGTANLVAEKDENGVYVVTGADTLGGGAAGGGGGSGNPPASSGITPQGPHPAFSLAVVGGGLFLESLSNVSGAQSSTSTIAAASPSPVVAPASAAPAATLPCYDLSDASGTVVAKCVTLPAGAIGPDGKVSIVGVDGKPLLDAKNNPLIIGSDATLPKPAADPNNPNNSIFADNRPAQPAQPPAAPAAPNNGQPQVNNFHIVTNGIGGSAASQSNNLMQNLGQLLGRLFGQPSAQQQQAPSTPQASVTLTAGSYSLASGATTSLSWSGYLVTSCNLFQQGGALLLAGGETGSTSTPAASSTATYLVQCQGSTGTTVDNGVTITVAPGL